MGVTAGVANAEDAIDGFLKKHWMHPLAAQGSPPADWSAEEGSLDPRQCAACHTQQYADWNTSLHSRSMGAGILWQTRALPPEQVFSCLNCHAPLAEQKALLAQQLQWQGAGKRPPPDYVPEDLHEQGLVCAACHVRGHQRFGPPPKQELPDTGLPHNGFVESAAFEDSRFCASCHQFPDDGPSLNGKLLENTYREWSESRFADEGRSCQSCHMPDRRHLWRGIHDPSMVAEALAINLQAWPTDDGAVRVEASILNQGAGHYFPTYLVPKVWLQLLLLDKEGKVNKTLDEQIVTRDVDVWLSEEFSDSRIAPGDKRFLVARLETPPPADWTFEVRVVVAPREHYERMFATVMRNNAHELDEQTRTLLTKAFEEARATRYTATRTAIAVPTGSAN